MRTAGARPANQPWKPERTTVLRDTPAAAVPMGGGDASFGKISAVRAANQPWKPARTRGLIGERRAVPIVSFRSAWEIAGARPANQPWKPERTTVLRDTPAAAVPMGGGDASFGKISAVRAANQPWKPARTRGLIGERRAVPIVSFRSAWEITGARPANQPWKPERTTVLSAMARSAVPIAADHGRKITPNPDIRAIAEVGASGRVGPDAGVGRANSMLSFVG